VSLCVFSNTISRLRAGYIKIKPNNKKNEIKTFLYRETIQWTPTTLTIKSWNDCFRLSFQTSVQAQETIEVKYSKPSWYFCVAGGANFNFYRGSTQHASFTSPKRFIMVLGLDFSLHRLEYRPADSRWGVMLQAGYDSRKGDFDQVITACDCPADLSTNLSYITVEPSLRFALLNLILFIWWSTFGFQLG
jgi:hypothetical protein